MVAQGYELEYWDSPTILIYLLQNMLWKNSLLLYYLN